MKKDILKTAGVRSEKEFYKKYPTEEAFIAAHPDFANKMQMGGTREAFPQTATMDNFFSYGVPAPPNYLANGGMPNAFPQAQTENQFFIPIYTDVYNPYNKEQGGSMPEMFPQVGNVEYQPPANMWFQEGGEPLEEVGVQNRLGKFMAQIGERASIAANKQVGQSAMGMMRAGGNLPKYQTGSTAPGKYKSVSDFVTQNPLDAYTGTQFQYDPAYGDAFAAYINSMYRDYYELDPDHAVYKDDPIYKQLSEAYGYKGKPTNTSTSTPKYDLNQLASDRTSRGRGPVKSKGYVNGEFGRGRNDKYMWQSMFNTDNFAEAQRLADQYGMSIEEGKAGLLGRRNKYTYTWGNTPGGGGAGTAPGQQGAGSNAMVANAAGSNQAEPNAADTSGMGFFERMFYQPGNKYMPDANMAANPELGKPLNMPQMQSAFDPTGYNADYSKARNQIFQNRKRRTGEKLDELYYNKELAERNNAPYFSNRDQRRMGRLENRFNRIGPDSGYGFNAYEEPTILDAAAYAASSAPVNTQTSTVGKPNFAASSSYAPTTLAGYLAPADLVAGEAPENPNDYGQPTTQYRQAPSSATSMDPNVAKKKASYMPKTTAQLTQYVPNEDAGEIPNNPVDYYNPILRYNPDDYDTGVGEMPLPAQAYGGIPMARWGLNKDHNQIIDKDVSWFDTAVDKYSGPENFYQRQMKKGIATDILNMNQPDFNTNIEDMYPAPGTSRGTFDVLNNNNMPYKNNYAVKDDFAPGFKAGGNYRKGDVIYWDEDTINAFIQAGGQVEYLD